MNNTLIPVFESTINEELVQTVNARDLHTFLESKQDFSTWIKSRIDQYGFIENQDFTLVHRKMEQVSGAKYLIEYHITIDMAKEVSMVERNEKGKEARRYFIACEKRLNDISSLSPAELLVRQAQMLLTVEKEQKRQAEELKLLTERQRITEVKIEDFANGAEHFSITAYNKLFRNNQISHSEANKDGRQLSKIARDSGVQLGKAPHPTFGTVHAYPKALMDSFYRGEYH